jgi:hypothetical protein
MDADVEGGSEDHHEVCYERDAHNHNLVATAHASKKFGSKERYPI